MSATLMSRLSPAVLIAALVIAAPAALTAQGTAQIHVTARVVAASRTIPRPSSQVAQQPTSVQGRSAPASDRYKVTVRLSATPTDANGAPLQVWVRDAAGREQRIVEGQAVAVAVGVSADTVRQFRASVRIASDSGATVDGRTVALAYEVGSQASLAQ